MIINELELEEELRIIREDLRNKLNLLYTYSQLGDLDHIPKEFRLDCKQKAFESMDRVLAIVDSITLKIVDEDNHAE